MNEDWSDWITWAGLIIALIVSGTTLYLAIKGVT